LTAQRYILIRFVGALGIVACPLAIVLLLQIRPPLPTLPRSLSSPITLPLVQGVLDLAAWAAAVGLAALLFAHALRALFVRRPVSSAWVARIAPRPRPRPLAQERLAAGARQGGFPPPFPLVLRPRQATEHEPERAVAPVPARESVAVMRKLLLAAESPLRARAPIQRWEDLPPPGVALLGRLTIAVVTPGQWGLRAQTRQFLAFLALHSEGATTDQLVAALYPEAGEKVGRKRIYRSVSEVRSQLGDVILRVGERYQLDRTAVTVDADQFEQLVGAAVAADPGAEREALLEQALELVRGQPLAGSDFAWAAGEVRRLRAIVVERLGDLGRLRLDDGNAAAALAVAERALELDPYHEAAHRLAMEAEAALGLRGAIIERYEQLTQELGSGLGLEPERDTKLMYRRLLSQDAEESR
jgi:DNA-binding SARP family transcriptional activator